MDNKEDWSSLDKDVGDVLENIPVDNMEFDSLGELDESKDTFSNKARSLKKDDDKMNNKKKENNNNGYKISKDFFKIIGLIVSGLLLVISLWIMTKCFTPAQEMTNSVLAYNTTNQADYKVHLLKNDFYETDTLGVGEIVPVTFIDKIEIDFSSFLSANKQLNMDYSYHISGVITASSDNGDNEDAGGKIWTKNYEFVEPKSFSESNVTGYAVQEKVIIDYQQYNDLVNRYKLRAAIPMEAALTVTLTVDANSVVENEPLTESTAVSVTIPLSKSTVQIKTSGDGTNSNSLDVVEKIAANKNFVLLAISVLVFIASLITTIMLLKSLRKMTVEHSLLLKFNKIMRDYNQIIIEIEELPEVRNAAVIEVKTFKDMLDVQKELHLPIMCKRTKTDDVKDNYFYIVNQNQIFKYQMNDENEKF